MELCIDLYKNRLKMLMKKKTSLREQLIKEFRCNTRKVYSAEGKILIVMEGIRGEISVAELCSKYDIDDSNYDKCTKSF